MEGTVDDFSYGFVTPAAAYLMACLGGALGLRCLTRSLDSATSGRAGWLALGSAALGSSIWVTHFIAMMGFTVKRTPITYDALTIFAGLAVGIVMVGSGIFIIGHRGATGAAVFTGGTVIGLGVASTHFLGMAGMTLGGRLEYDTLTVAGSVLIAVLGAVAALWAAVQARGRLWSAGASLVLGLAFTGMHYVAMAAVDVHLYDPAGTPAGDLPAKALAPMLTGPLAFLLLAAVIVLCDLLKTAGRRHRSTAGSVSSTLVPAPRTDPYRSSRLRPEPSRTGSRAPYNR